MSRIASIADVLVHFVRLFTLISMNKVLGFVLFNLSFAENLYVKDFCCLYYSWEFR